MFDLVDHHHLKALLADFDTQMKPIAAICHGVVGLVNVRRTQGASPLIQGRMLTGFSLEEEMSSRGEEENLVTKNPFILEVKLKDQGALYMKANPGKEHVLQDGLLLTGQNPASARQLDSDQILRGKSPIFLVEHYSTLSSSDNPFVNRFACISTFVLIVAQKKRIITHKIDSYTRQWREGMQFVSSRRRGMCSHTKKPSWTCSQNRLTSLEQGDGQCHHQ